MERVKSLKIPSINTLFKSGYGKSIPTITSDLFKSFFKEKRFYIALIYYVIIPLFLVLVQSSQPVIQTGTGIAIYNAQLITTAYVKTLFLSFFPGQIFLVILSADLIAGEIESETYPLLISKPVYTSEIVLGKFLGTLSVLAVLEAPTLVLTYVMSLIKYKAEWYKAYLFSIDEVVMMLIIVLLLQGIVIALAILISSLFSRSLYAILTSMLSLFILSSASDLMASNNQYGISYLSFNWLIDAVLPGVFFNLEPLDHGSILLIPFLLGIFVVIAAILSITSYLLDNKEIY